MAFSQIFGLDNSSVSEANFQAVFGNLGEGVFSHVGEQCVVSATSPPSASVNVGTGIVVVGGVYMQVTSPENLTIPANTAADPRIDRIVCRRDNVNNTVAVHVKQGTPAASPVPPALARTADIWEISLAQVRAAPGFTSIASADITDERFDPAVCGFVSAHGRRSRPLVLDVNKDEVVVSNTTSTTTIYSGTIPLGLMVDRGVAKLVAGGSFYIGTTGSVSFGVRVEVGSTSGSFMSPMKSFSVDANNLYAWWTEVHVLSILSSAVRIHGSFVCARGVSTGHAGFALMTGGEGSTFGVGAIDRHFNIALSGPVKLDLLTAFNVANTALQVRRRFALLEYLPPP